jgi:hypothetical protein
MSRSEALRKSFSSGLTERTDKDMAKNELTIRSSSAEFLIFEEQSHADGIEVIYQDGTLWMSQRMMGLLFDVEANTITYHLGEIYKSGELEQISTTRKIRVVQQEGKRNVNREIDHYNLDAIISVGYRVNSIKATQFRRWATQVLSQYTQKGYVIDRKRMENGAFLDEDYFEELLEEIREIRLSERRFYQKLTDIYATSMDYDKNAPTTKLFFAKIQNQLHYAVSHQTAAEIIYNRADSAKDHMGLSTWKKAPDGKILKSDVSIAKNYLSKDELDDLSLIVNAVLDFAEARARRHIPMTMQDWAERMEKYLLSDDRDILTDAGKISMEIAKDHAESEYEKYRITQDRLYESDFDKLIQESKKHPDSI